MIYKITVYKNSIGTFVDKIRTGVQKYKNSTESTSEAVTSNKMKNSPILNYVLPNYSFQTNWLKSTSIIVQKYCKSAEPRIEL